MTTNDKEIDGNPHRPGGLRPNGTVFVVAPPRNIGALPLSSDHGTLPLVENLHARGVDARRAHPQVLIDALERAISQKYPDSEGLISYISTNAEGVYLNEGLIRRGGLDRREVETTISDALKSTGFVESVYTHEQMVGDGPASDPYIDLFRNSFLSSRTPHLMVLPKKYVYVDLDPGGSGHGTPYDYDRHVPIIFMGEEINPGRYADPCGPEGKTPGF